MPSFEHEVEIAAPIEHVFEWGVQPENWQRTTPSITDIEVVGETPEGTRYRNTMRVLGRTVVSEELFVIDEENYHTTSHFDDDELQGEMHYYYTESDEGTVVRMVGEFQPGTSLFERAVQPVLNRYLNRQFRNSLRTMQELIEAELDDHVEAAA